MTDVTDLTAFQQFTLEVIARIESTNDESYGLNIKRRLEGRYHQEVNHGRLYPNLDDLVERGLLAKGKLDERTNSYELTDQGRHLLRERAEELQGLVERMDDEQDVEPELVVNDDD